MAVIIHKCPHCGTDGTALSVIGLHVLRKTKIEADGKFPVSVGLICPICEKPCSAQITKVISKAEFQKATQRGGGPSVISDFEKSLTQALRSEPVPSEALGYSLDAFWPTPPEPRVPQHLHPNVERVMLQAERSYLREDNEAAAMMYGKALEVSIDTGFPDLKSIVLQKKIDKLVADGRLTKEIGEWAHEIRLMRNEAVHDASPVAREELTAMRDFSDSVLRYLFTLPQEVAIRRAAAKIASTP
jgi:hypothetical protein